MQRTCQHCSEQIPESRKANAKYCSDYCRGMRFYEANREPAKPKPSEEERFESFLAPADANGCIVWTGSTFGDDGYGAFFINGKTIGAHRHSFERANGPIPQGLLVRHRCDNRKCVNPEHLEPGTYADNAADASERNRRPLGVYSRAARLTDQQVAEIRALCAAGERQRDVARIYGCTQAHVSLLVRGKLRSQPSAPAVKTPRRVA